MSEDREQRTEREGFESWAVVELMGHNVTAGLVTEESIAGAMMLRVDVPAVNGREAFTRYFGGGAIYSLTPCSQAAALAVIERHQPRPMTPYVPALEHRSALREEDEF